MSEQNESSGASPGPDDNPENAMISLEETTISKPEKHLLVCKDSNIVLHTVCEPETSRAVPSSELDTDTASVGNLPQFYGNVESEFQSVDLLSPPDDAHLETGGMKLRVASSDNSQHYQELVVKDQELEDEDSLEKERIRSVKIQVSKDEPITPLKEQYLMDRISTMETTIQELRQSCAEQKQRREEAEKKLEEMIASELYGFELVRSS